MHTAHRSLAPILALTTLAIAAPRARAAEAAEQADPKPRIEVCFALDTTGSMGGLIEGAKTKIWSIANEIAKAKPTPQVRFGLIGYRDRGDEYVTRVFDLTEDIDAIYGSLHEFRADGGGDTPESVNQALHEAVTKMTWTPSRDVLKIVFLVGDCPPHMDYTDDTKYPDTCQQAVKTDLIINTILCGGNEEAARIWQEIARLSEGEYAAIGQSGDMIAVTTPFDEKIASVSRELGGTVLAYGAPGARHEVASKLALSASAPAAVAADRVAFAGRAAGGAVVTGEGDLLGAIEEGTVKLAELKPEELPAELRDLEPAAREKVIAERQAERQALQEKVNALVKEREEYLRRERERLAQSGTKDAFDEKVAEMIRQQAARKGIQYQTP